MCRSFFFAVCASLLLLVMGLSCLGQTLVVVSEDGQAAWYASSGRGPLNSVELVFRLGGRGPRLPEPIPGRGREVAAMWRTNVSPYRQLHDDRLALQAMYETLAEFAEQGLVPTVEMFRTLHIQGVASVLGANVRRWDTWGRGIAVVFDREVSSLGDAPGVCREVVAGLDNGDTIGEQLLALIRLFMKLLLDRLLEGLVPPK